MGVTEALLACQLDQPHTLEGLWAELEEEVVWTLRSKLCDVSLSVAPSVL